MCVCSDRSKERVTLPLSIERRRRGRSPVLIVLACGVAAVVLVGLAIFLATRPAEIAVADEETSGETGAVLVGFATPREAFEANQKATVAKDWGVQIRAWTSESQEKLAGTVAYFAVSIAKSRPEIGGVLEKHGVEESLWEDDSPAAQPGDFAAMAQRIQKRQKQLATAIDDLPAFYAEIVPQMEAIGKQREAGADGSSVSERQAEAEKAQADAQLGNVQIDGDTAVGTQTLTFRGNPMSIPVYFRRIDGRWFMHQPDATALEQKRPEPDDAAATLPDDAAATLPDDVAAILADDSVWKLTISGKIDGSERLEIFRDRVKWTHLTFEIPRDVAVNGTAWNLEEKTEFSFDQPTKDVLADAPFPKALMVKTKGRGRILFTKLKDVVKVGFDDNGPGPDDYEVVIWFDEAK